MCAVEAIQVLESTGLYVGAIIADWALSNRKYFNLHKLQNKENLKDGVVCWTYPHWTNPEAGFQKTYLICDISHLMKTTNSIENLHGNLNTRNLVVNLKIFY